MSDTLPELRRVRDQLGNALHVADTTPSAWLRSNRDKAIAVSGQ